MQVPTGHNDLWASENVIFRNSEFHSSMKLRVLLITTLHHTTSAVVGEVTTATIPKKHSSNNLSVHHFVLASMRHNNLPFLEVSYL